MFQHILVPLDGSARSEQALPVAARIARMSGGSITLLYVVTPPLYHNVTPFEPYIMAEHAWENEREHRLVEARHYLTCAAASECLEGLGVRLIVEMGAPGAIIVEYTKKLLTDLVVMSSHGRTGFTRWTLGSVALKVARLSAAPVFILRENKLHIEQPTQVLLALDGTAEGETALPPAAYLSAALASPGRLHLCCVLHLPTAHHAHVEEIAVQHEQARRRLQTYLTGIQQRFYDGDLAALKLEVTFSILDDADLSETLVRLAEIGDEAAGVSGNSLIAMTTHSPDSLIQRIMGSITEQVLNGTRLPMLIVHPRPTTSAETFTEEDHEVSSREPVHA